jgi:16S rRNA (guanine966-N2)-methyltransferase
MRARNSKIKQLKNAGQVRIIGGKYRSRKLKVHDIEGLRPTTDRVKETLFNWLMPYLSNAKVLDCFAGSGGLGFEALSRYAKEVVFIELDSQAHQQLKDNLKQFSADNAQTLKGSCLDIMPKLDQQFDIIFVDPPFRKNLAMTTCHLIEQHNLLLENGIIYLEVERELSEINLPNNWQILKQKDFGQITSFLIHKVG